MLVLMALPHACLAHVFAVPCGALAVFGGDVCRAQVGVAWFLEVPIFTAYRRTLPLTLLTSLNEATTIGFALGLPRTFDLPNR
jgi:hypothetical protein